MSDAAAALAAPISIKHKGKEYPLSPLSLDMIAMFERWLENRAFETIELRKGGVSEDDYERLLGSWVEQCASGRYRWAGKAAQRAARTKEGMSFLLFVQLAEKNPQMTQRLAAEILEAGLSEVRAKMEVVDAGPFEQTKPAATETPSPSASLLQSSPVNPGT